MTSKKADGQRYGITLDSLRSDLESGRPLWILSAFGPGNADVPVQLMGGLPLEQSAEELRLQYYFAAAAGKGHEAVRIYIPFFPLSNFISKKSPLFSLYGA